MTHRNGPCLGDIAQIIVELNYIKLRKIKEFRKNLKDQNYMEILKNLDKYNQEIEEQIAMKIKHRENKINRRILERNQKSDQSGKLNQLSNTIEKLNEKAKNLVNNVKIVEQETQEEEFKLKTNLVDKFMKNLASQITSAIDLDAQDSELLQYTEIMSKRQITKQYSEFVNSFRRTTKSLKEQMAFSISRLNREFQQELSEQRKQKKYNFKILRQYKKEMDGIKQMAEKQMKKYKWDIFGLFGKKTVRDLNAETVYISNRLSAMVNGTQNKMEKLLKQRDQLLTKQQTEEQKQELSKIQKDIQAMKIMLAKQRIAKEEHSGFNEQNSAVLRLSKQILQNEQQRKMQQKQQKQQKYQEYDEEIENCNKEYLKKHGFNE
jgi:hypothetical protein